MDLSGTLEPPPETWSVRSPHWHAYLLSGVTGRRERRHHTPARGPDRPARGRRMGRWGPHGALRSRPRPRIRRPAHDTPVDERDALIRAPQQPIPPRLGGLGGFPGGRGVVLSVRVVPVSAPLVLESLTAYECVGHVLVGQVELGLRGIFGEHIPLAVLGGRRKRAHGADHTNRTDTANRRDNHQTHYTGEQSSNADAPSPTEAGVFLCSRLSMRRRTHHART